MPLPPSHFLRDDDGRAARLVRCPDCGQNLRGCAIKSECTCGRPVLETLECRVLQVGVSPTGKLSRNQPCRKCGYDLFGAMFDGVCPECGCSVRRSACAASIRDDLPIFVASARGGARWIVIGAIGIVASIFGALLVSPWCHLGWMASILLLIAGSGQVTRAADKSRGQAARNADPRVRPAADLWWPIFFCALTLVAGYVASARIFSQLAMLLTTLIVWNYGRSLDAIRARLHLQPPGARAGALQAMMIWMAILIPASVSCSMASDEGSLTQTRSQIVWAGGLIALFACGAALLFAFLWHAQIAARTDEILNSNNVHWSEAAPIGPPPGQNA